MPNAEARIADRIVSHLQEMLAGQQHVQAITSESDLIGGDILDSLSIVRLIQFVENEFDVRIPDQAIGPELFSSARSLAGFITRQR